MQDSHISWRRTPSTMLRIEMSQEAGSQQLTSILKSRIEIAKFIQAINCCDLTLFLFLI